MIKPVHVLAFIFGAEAIAVGAFAGPFDTPRVASGGLTIASYAGAGTTQSDATPVTTDIAYLASGAANSGFRLPSCTLGRVLQVFQNQNLNVKIYPAVGDSFYSAGANSPINTNNDQKDHFLLICYAANTWQVMKTPDMDLGSNNYSRSTNFQVNGALLVIGGLTMQTTATLAFNGSTGNNKITLTDNLASALDITESTNSYLAFITTNNAERLVITKPVSHKASTSLTAYATGGQANATVICDDEDVADVTTVASAGDSSKFPVPGEAGKSCAVSNRGANSMNLFPASGGTLCMSGSACAAADAAIAVAANTMIDCVAISTTVWRCR